MKGAMSGMPIKRVLQVHNRYVWSPGGEISVLESEAELLRAHGVEVEQFFVDNPDEISGLGNKLKAAKNIVWSNDGLQMVRKAIQQSKPDIVHVHNFFIHLSPSVYKACNLEGVPVVQTLHNFRTCCAQAAFMRDGRACQDCVGRFPFPALKHKCYRGSLSATVPLVLMQQVNRWNGAFTHMCDGYICLSEFAKEIFARSGLPVDRIHIKPNFAADHGASAKPRENKMVFVGRIVEEKGPHVLVDAWLKAQPKGWTCHILGEGEMKDALMAKSQDCPSLVWHGWVQKDEVEEFIQTSKYVVMTSTCYEGFPLALAEALSFGTPAIVPNHGAMPEIMQCPDVGLAANPSDPEDFARVITEAASLPDTNWQTRSQAARHRFEGNYTPEINFHQLMEIYQKVDESPHRRRSR
ncbi:MAG: glycosyltransferase family 4 protein [Armatimonadetes bacterium]|nr:glycosyltransferase family 4 protein [Armatimonadota bacterium]MBX3107713.1 glycosyltransferase family 4 protein [Fimbriimonadaceae bacterium]